MLELGVIGVGPDWERRYRPVLDKLRHRIRVRAVYAPVSGRAHAAAAEFGGDVAPGLIALVERPDVRGILLLEPAWYTPTAARFACERGKPVFLAGSVTQYNGEGEALQRLATEKGITLMPELGRRYTPSTVRLRELIATRLGPPRQIAIEADVPHDASHASQSAHRELLVELIDWCRNLLGTAPVIEPPSQTVSVTKNADPACSRDITFHFRSPNPDAEIIPARFRIRSASQSSRADNVTAHRAVKFHVWCAEGAALLEDEMQIVWEQSGVQIIETLTSERTDVEVLFDLFCRRAVGGLIPVPTLEDVFTAHSVAAKFFAEET